MPDQSRHDLDEAVRRMFPLGLPARGAGRGTHLTAVLRSQGAAMTDDDRAAVELLRADALRAS